MKILISGYNGFLGKHLLRSLKFHPSNFDIGYLNKNDFKSSEILSKKISKNDIIFLTLPTPKQEQIAIELAKKNNHYKIICIGASISIASGQEKSVPKYFENFEFLWRLRTEPIRRLNRLFVSFFYFFVGKYFQKKLDYLNIYTVD